MIKLRLKFFFTIGVWGHRNAPTTEVNFRDLKMLWVFQCLAFPRIPLAVPLCLCLIFGLAVSVGNLSAQDHWLKKDDGAYGQEPRVQGEASGKRQRLSNPVC